MFPGAWHPTRSELGASVLGKGMPWQKTSISWHGLRESLWLRQLVEQGSWSCWTTHGSCPPSPHGQLAGAKDHRRGAQAGGVLPEPDVLSAHPSSLQAPALPLMLLTHHSEVLPVHEKQALVTIVVPSVLLPWRLCCSHAALLHLHWPPPTG